MGAVWLAEDTRLHRQVALKMVRPADHQDDASRAGLMREARAAAALNHPHLATVHDVLEQDGQIVIVFEYVEGETLHARMARGPVPAPEAVDIASQIAKALVAAHAHGIVHRDLKPANVMVIAVIERRSEIGLRRALGATRAHIRRQFLTEALLLAFAGGVTGVAIGAVVTAVYARIKGWTIVVPPIAIAGGLVAAIVIGAVAGLYPATRAARLAPTEALR